MKRISLIGIPIIAAAIVAGCGSDSQAQEKPDQIRVCKDPKTNQVVEDDKCEPQKDSNGRVVHHHSGGSPFLWWYMGYMSGGYPRGYYINSGSPTYTGTSKMGFASNGSAQAGGGWSSTGRSFGSTGTAGLGSTGRSAGSGAIGG